MTTHDPERHGAKQPGRFNPERAALLDDRTRFDYLPPAEVVALLALPEGGTLLDFGAGTGTYAIEIAQRRPDVRVYALDEQPEMLLRMHDKSEARALANLMAVDPAGLAPLVGTLDRILALNVLHELGDDALASLRTLLGPDGRALVIDWNADVERPVGPRAGHVYGVQEARERLVAAGFAVTPCAGFAYHYAFLAEPVRAIDLASPPG